MKLSQVLFVVLLSIVSAFAVETYLSAKHQETAQQTQAVKESAYARVMRTGTLRCAYTFWPRLFEKDLNTGAYTGIFYDLLEEMGRQTSLKIEWTEEVGTANVFEGLKSGRYDAVCLPFTPSPARARVTDFSVPVMFLPYVILVRPDDTRFDHDIGKLNDPSVRISVMDGEFGQTIARTDFPLAQTVSLPNLTSISQVIDQVAAGKADMVMTEGSTAYDYLTKNPGRLKQLDTPVRVLPGGVSVGIAEFALKDLLDTTIEALQTSGFMQRLIDKYSGGAPGIFLMPAQPWKPVKP